MQERLAVSDFFSPKLLLLRPRRIQFCDSAWGSLDSPSPDGTSSLPRVAPSLSSEAINLLPASASHFRATRFTVDKRDSIGLVVVGFCRNRALTPNRRTVRVSSRPSSRLLAALGLIPPAAARSSRVRPSHPRSSSSRTHCGCPGRSPPGSSPAGALSHSAACETGSAAPRRDSQRRVPQCPPSAEMGVSWGYL